MTDLAGSRAAALADLLPGLVAGLPALLSDVVDELRSVSPEYAAALTERDLEVLPAAEVAMRRLLSTAGQAIGPRRGRQPEASGALDGVEAQAVQQLFEDVGRNQWRAGYPLPTLLGAFQAGARVAWRHVSAVALAAAVDPEGLAVLGGALFELVDQLSSAAAAGFVAEQEEAALSQQRLRDELVELLLSDRSDSTAVRSAARRAGWPLPETATVVLAAAEDEESRRALTRLGPSSLRFRTQTVQGAVVPDPAAPGRRELLTAVLGGCPAVVGPVVSVDALPMCARMSRVATDLLRAGVLRATPVFVDDHLGSLLVHREPRLLETLRGRRLAPLEAATPGSRPQLQDTLRSWLVHMGDNRAVAADLQVHPQTVRYRLARLRELFGTALDDPTVRLELLLVLAWG